MSIDQLLEKYLTEEKDNPHGFNRYSNPQRKGNSAKAWKDYIIQIMLYHEWRFDTQTWTATVGDNITKTGVKALMELEKEGKVQVEIIKQRKGGQPVYSKGKLVSWGGSDEWTDFKVTML